MKEVIPNPGYPLYSSDLLVNIEQYREIIKILKSSTTPGFTVPESLTEGSVNQITTKYHNQPGTDGRDKETRTKVASIMQDSLTNERLEGILPSNVNKQKTVGKNKRDKKNKSAAKRKH